MKFSRSLAILVLGFVGVALLAWETQRHGTSIPGGSRTRVYLVENFTQDEAFREPGKVGVLPSRAGRVGEEWSLEDTIRTGSRSPVPPDAPRWTGTIERVRSAAGVPRPTAEEGRLLIGLPRREGELVYVALRTAQDSSLTTLTSPSTRFTPGLIAATDLATTLAERPVGAGSGVYRLNMRPAGLSDRVAVWEAQHRAMASLKFVPWALAVLLAFGAWRRWPYVGRFVLAYPLGLLLAPVLGLWELWIYVGAAGIAGVVASFGEKGVRAAAWATVFLMAVDQLLGGWVSARTPLSYSPIEAARFYGIGNEAGGYLIGAALLAAGGDVLTLALLGFATSALLGAPTLGANFGCFLASLVGFGAAIFARLPKSRWLAGGIGLALVAALAVFLVMRGSAGTHVGRAAAGGGEGRAAVIARKLAMNAHLTLTSPWALLAAVQLVLLWKKRKEAGLLAGAGAAWLLNDSGVVAAALALLWASENPPQAPPPGGGEGGKGGA